MALLADISHGHVDLSDWLLLIAAIVFAVAAVVTVVPAPAERPRPVWVSHAYLVAVGLCLFAVAWLVL